MRRFIFGLIFLFCTNALLAQVNTFPTFLQKLKEIGKIGILAFRDTIMEPNLTDVALKPYLSQISSRLSEVNDCTWQGGSYKI